MAADDWIDVRDDDGWLLFKWSPRLGVLEVAMRRRLPNSSRHVKEVRRVPLTVFQQLPAPADPPLVDKIPLSVV